MEGRIKKLYRLLYGRAPAADELEIGRKFLGNELRRESPVTSSPSAWQYGYGRYDEASKKVVDKALELGVNHFDTADIYGGGHSEEFLGRALGSKRRDVVITTKVGMGVPEGEPRANEERVTRV